MYIDPAVITVCQHYEGGGGGGHPPLTLLEDVRPRECISYAPLLWVKVFVLTSNTVVVQVIVFNILVRL